MCQYFFLYENNVKFVNVIFYIYQKNQSHDTPEIVKHDQK